MTGREKTLLVATALAMTLQGCATQSTPPQIAGCLTWEQQRAAGSPLPVSVLSPDLARVIGVARVTTGRTPAGMAQVQAQLHNCTDVDVVVLVRARFEGGAQPEPASAWRTVFLPPRAVAAYSESSVSAAASQVAIDIHDANRGQSQYGPGQSYPVPLPAAAQ